MGGLTVVEPADEASAVRNDGSSSADSQGTGGSSTKELDSAAHGSRLTQPESPRSKRRRELYETGEAINSMRNVGDQPTLSRLSEVEGEELEALARESSVTQPINDTVSPTAPSASIASALNATTSSLALTLDRLAGSLASHSSGTDREGEARYFVDVKLHTEAMRDVLEVMERVRRVR